MRPVTAWSDQSRVSTVSPLANQRRQHRQRPAPPGPCQGHDGVFHLVRAEPRHADCHEECQRMRQNA